MHKLGGLPIAVDDIVRAGHVCASKVRTVVFVV
jgi:hypothetical protein